MNDSIPIFSERRYKLPIEKVWEIVTNQRYLSQWLMPGNFRAEVGFHYYFQCFPPDGEWDGKVFGKIVEVNKPYSIKFTWNTIQLKKETMVQFQLQLVDDEVLFKIEHKGFSKQDKLQSEKHLSGWNYHLTKIEKIEGYEAI